MVAEPPVQEVGFLEASIRKCSTAFFERSFREWLRRRVKGRGKFSEVYVVAWWVALAGMLWTVKPGIVSGWGAICCVAGAYRVAELVAYRIYFWLVKSRERPWTRETVRRSLLIAALNLSEVSLAFGIWYLVGGQIENCKGVPLMSAVSALYFSVVTMATVGYGDFAPATDMMRCLVAAQIAVSMFFLVGLLPAAVSALVPDIFDAGHRAAGQERHS